MCILPRRRSRRKEGPTMCIGHAYTSMESIYFLPTDSGPFFSVPWDFYGTPADRIGPFYSLGVSSFDMVGTRY